MKIIVISYRISRIFSLDPLLSCHHTPGSDEPQKQKTTGSVRWRAPLAGLVYSHPPTVFSKRGILTQELVKGCLIHSHTCNQCEMASRSITQNKWTFRVFIYHEGIIVFEGSLSSTSLKTLESGGWGKIIHISHILF